MKSRRLNAEHAEIAELQEVLLCGLRGLCVELRISEQITDHREIPKIFTSVPSVCSVVIRKSSALWTVVTVC